MAGGQWRVKDNLAWSQDLTSRKSEKGMDTHTAIHAHTPTHTYTHTPERALLQLDSCVGSPRVDVTQRRNAPAYGPFYSG